MSRRVCMHRADHAQIIRVPGCVRKQAADRQPALPMLRELKRRLHQMPHRPSVRSHLRIAHIRLPMKLLQRRFRIKRVHLARPAIHEQEHAVLRLRRKMWSPLRQWRCRKCVRSHQVRQRQPRKSTADLPEKLPAGAATWRVIGNEAGHGLLNTLTEPPDHSSSQRPRLSMMHWRCSRFSSLLNCSNHAVVRPMSVMPMMCVPSRLKWSFHESCRG